MSEYYKVAATLPEPGFQGSPPPPRRGLPKSTPHPHVGTAKPKEPLQDPPWPQPSAPPREPSTWQANVNYEEKNEAPPAYAEDIGQPKYETAPLLKPAQVNPTLRDRCQKCERSLRRLLPLALLLAYTLLGGIVFHLIESYSQSKSEVAKGHLVLIDQPLAVQLERRMTEIVLDIRYDNDRRRDEVRKALLWYLGELTVEEKGRWDFASACFYSMTLYTTIGYGDSPPKTTGGQILTVVYSIFGIPLCLVALIELGYLIALCVSKLWSCLRHGWSFACGGRRRRSRLSKNNADWEALPSESEMPTKADDEQDDADLLSFPLSALILLTFLWILFTGLLFYVWQLPSSDSWTYGESLYFTFISFTTIGLGDFVPGNATGKLAGIFFLLVGLSLLSTTFAVLQQQLDALQNSMQRQIDSEYQDAQADATNANATIMATDEKGVDRGLKRMASKLPWGSRLLFYMMPEGKKENLKKYYKQKAAMSPKSMQTDDYLWAMTSMSRSYLKRIAEENRENGGGRDRVYGGDDSKSRDDVNSLVALCDYSLPYESHRNLEY